MARQRSHRFSRPIEGRGLPPYFRRVVSSPRPSQVYFRKPINASDLTDDAKSELLRTVDRCVFVAPRPRNDPPGASGSSKWFITDAATVHCDMHLVTTAPIIFLYPLLSLSLVQPLKCLTPVDLPIPDVPFVFNRRLRPSCPWPPSQGRPPPPPPPPARSAPAAKLIDFCTKSAHLMFEMQHQTYVRRVLHTRLPNALKVDRDSRLVEIYNLLVVPRLQSARRYIIEKVRLVWVSPDGGGGRGEGEIMVRRQGQEEMGGRVV